MKKELVSVPEMKIIGLSIRTNNKDEMIPETSKISKLVGHYFGGNLASQIPNRKEAGVTLAVYANYDSNEHGNYTYLIGEEVSSFDLLPAEMCNLVIPASRYQKFTTETGKMPEVVISAWKQIWGMAPNALDGERSYVADYERYDQRATDPENTCLDIYIGIK